MKTAKTDIWLGIIALVIVLAAIAMFSYVVSAAPIPITLTSTDTGFVVNDSRNSFSVGLNQSLTVMWSTLDCNATPSCDLGTVAVLIANLSENVNTRCSNLSTESVLSTLNGGMNTNFLALQTYLEPKIEQCTTTAVSLQTCVDQKVICERGVNNVSVELEKVKGQRDTAFAQGTADDENYRNAKLLVYFLLGVIVFFFYIVYLHPRIRGRFTGVQ